VYCHSIAGNVGVAQFFLPNFISLNLLGEQQQLTTSVTAIKTGAQEQEKLYMFSLSFTHITCSTIKPCGLFSADKY
jgi:hypothetical protein